MKKGDKFCQSFKVTESISKRFIELFNDRHPLHTNRIYARKKGFNCEVAHGNILNGFISYFVGECLPWKDVILQTQEIKYYHPVYPNDHLKFYAQVNGVFESVNTIELKYYFENKDKIKVAKGKIQIGRI